MFLCDIGKGKLVLGQQIILVRGISDGILDWYYLENSMDLSHEWVINQVALQLVTLMIFLPGQ